MTKYNDPTHLPEKINPNVPAPYNVLAKNVRNKMFGEDVRESIAQSIEGAGMAVNEWEHAQQALTVDSEVINARIALDGTRHSTLKVHLDSVWLYCGTLLSMIKSLQTDKVDIDEFKKQMATKVDSQIFSDKITEFEKQIADTQSGLIGTFKNESELKKAYPNGAKGFAIVQQADGKQDYAYTWDEKKKTWARGWPVVRSQLSLDYEELKQDADKIEYASARKAQDMQDGKRVSRIDYLSNEISDYTNYLDLDWRLGHIEETTGNAPAGAYSDRIYSKRIELKEGEIVTFEPPNNVSGLVFLYNGDKFVKNSGYFTTKYYQVKDDSFTHIIVTAGYRTSSIIDSKEKLERLSSIVKVEKVNKRTITQKINDLEVKSGLIPLSYEYGKVRNNFVNYGEVVETKATNNGQWKSIFLDCVEGDIFQINGTGGVAPRLWAFLDKENKLIAISKSSLTVKDLFLVAPARSKKIIINTIGEGSCFKVDLNSFNDEILINENAMAVGTIATGNTEIGEVNSTIPNYNIAYASIILPVSVSEKILIDGVGGDVPRFWSFLDKEFKQLQKSEKETASIRITEIKNIPEKVKYLVINSNLEVRDPRVKIGYKNIENSIVSRQTNYAQQRRVPSTVLLNDFMNGVKLSDELGNPMFDFNMPGDKMLHSGSFRIIDDVVYAAMYINKIGVDEKETQHTSVLRVKKLDGTEETENYNVCEIGDVVFGSKVTALYDTIILDESDDIRILFVAKLGNEWYQLFRLFDPVTKTLGEIMKMTFSYKGIRDDFSIKGLQNVLKANNVYYPFLNRHPNFLSTISHRVEDGEKYWYIGLGMKDFCFIAKTKDFIDVEYVSQPTFIHNPQYEASVYVVGNEVIYFERQEMWEFTPYSLLSKYNLVTGEWAEPVKIIDTQSRSDFIFYNKKLYLIHAPFNRNHIAITEINTKVLEMSFTLATAYVDDLFFPFVKEYNNKIYMIATKGRKYMNFAEFTIPKFEIGDTVELFKKLINL